MIRTIILALLWGLMLLGLMYGAIMEAENNTIYEKHHGGQYDYR